MLTYCVDSLTNTQMLAYCVDSLTNTQMLAYCVDSLTNTQMLAYCVDSLTNPQIKDKNPNHKELKFQLPKYKMYTIIIPFFGAKSKNLKRKTTCI